ncbi:MAG: FG-GAP-like repeat-containing protein, partial [Candidatus Eremiobacterota bacterium]
MKHVLLILAALVAVGCGTTRFDQAGAGAAQGQQGNNAQAFAVNLNFAGNLPANVGSLRVAVLGDDLDLLAEQVVPIGGARADVGRALRSHAEVAFTSTDSGLFVSSNVRIIAMDVVLIDRVTGQSVFRALLPFPSSEVTLTGLEMVDVPATGTLSVSPGQVAVGQTTTLTVPPAFQFGTRFTGIPGLALPTDTARQPGTFMPMRPGVYPITATYSPPNRNMYFAEDAGGLPIVRVTSGPGGLVDSFFAYDPAFRGGVRIAVGDVNGDGVADVVTAPGPGMGPRVKVFDGTDHHVRLADFLAYAPSFTGGVYVATGDVNGDGVLDILTGPDSGGPPNVRVFGLNGSLISSFMAYDGAFTGGVRVATGDVNGDGVAEIITAPGPGAENRVRLFDAVGGVQAVLDPIQQYQALNVYDEGFIVSSAPGPGGDLLLLLGFGNPVDFPAATLGPAKNVLVHNFGTQTGTGLNPFPGYPGGVRVSSGDVDQDGDADLITATGAGMPAFITSYDVANFEVCGDSLGAPVEVIAGGFPAGRPLNADLPSNTQVATGTLTGVPTPGPGRLFVTVPNGAQLLTYDPTDNLAGVVPGSLSGPATTLNQPAFMASDDDELFVSDVGSNQVLVFDRNATGNTAPVRVLGGPATGLNNPG